jgi:hypothetical protein
LALRWRLSLLLVLGALSGPSLQAQFFNDILVIAGPQGCGSRPARSIDFDNEDTNNGNDRWGWLGGIVSNRNTRFNLCLVNSADFRPGPEPYMVLSAYVDLCPYGTWTVTRVVDCENHKPACKSDLPGVILSSQARDVKLTFCVYHDGAQFSFPGYGIEYGVFAAPSFGGALETGWVYMDDQQADISGDNHNRWCGRINGVFDEACDEPHSYFHNYFDTLEGNENTSYSLARVR